MRKRSKHTLSHYRMITSKMGELTPIACVPVLPGDTVQHHTSALVRAAPLNTPVMHPVRVRIHHFFVPNRLTWPASEDGGWEEFITGGPDGDNAATFPTVLNGSDKKGVLQYLGVPPTDANATAVSALPLRAFGLIYNEYYRDQDIIPERDWESNVLPTIAWEKDYFTTSRPWTQKGPDVTIPIRGDVIGGNVNDPSASGPSPTWETAGGTNLGQTLSDVGSGGDEFGLYPADQAANSPGEALVKFAVGTRIGAYVENASASVNDFREAFAIQRYQEARARYGSRFTEYLRYLGITPSDARLQRPEYLGGGVTRLQFSEVLQTTPGAEGEAGVGDLYGHGIAGARTNRYRKFFEEHGFIISVMSVRPKAIYVDGVPREWLKRTKEDFFQRELVHLGQQAIKGTEIHAEQEPSVVFGYQDRYDEYRQQWSQVSQDFRDTLTSWHLGRLLPNTVTLNDDFINCRPDDRIFQVQEGDNLWIMCNHHMVARRLLPKRARPRIL